VCHFCGQIIVDLATVATYQGQVYHVQCISQVSALQSTIRTDQSVLIQNSLSTINFTMQMQPAAYQIAHYNIFPAPVVTIKDSTSSEAFRAVLIDATSCTVITGGFTTVLFVINQSYIVHLVVIALTIKLQATYKQYCMVPKL